jgi:hypothetical protein
MKMNQLFALCGIVAALFVGAVSASAQNGGGGGFGGGNGGGNGGGGGGGFRNMDPAQRQQFFMDRIRTQLEFTNDSDWSAVQPLVQKVLDARQAIGVPGMRMFFGGRNRGGQNGGGDQGNRQRGGGMFGGQPSPEEQALQDAIDNNAPDSQIKDLLARYQASQKAKQDKLTQAQEALRAVLSVKQEATATLMGLVD